MGKGKGPFPSIDFCACNCLVFFPPARNPLRIARSQRAAQRARARRDDSPIKNKIGQWNKRGNREEINNANIPSTSRLSLSFCAPLRDGVDRRKEMAVPHCLLARAITLHCHFAAKEQMTSRPRSGVCDRGTVHNKQ